MKFPEKCPHCGKDINDKYPIKSIYEDSDEHGIVAQLHRCIHCDKPIFVFREYCIGFVKGSPNGFNSTIEAEDILSYYPTNPTIDLPKHIKEISPESCKIYSDTYNAYQNGLNSLVGSGLRMALEWLVWDYLIKIKNIPETDVEKLKLFERIQKMDAPLYTNICAKLIRLFGNDQVHIIKKLDFTFDEVFNAYNILCDLINNELDLIEIQKRLTT